MIGCFRVAVEALVVVMVLAFLGILAMGCQRIKPPQIPSNQMTPVVWNSDTAAVLGKGLDTGGKVLASCLEQNTESGSVIYVNYDGWVYNPDGTLFLDQQGKPIRLKYEVVAKLNSLKELAEMQGVEEADYIVGGFGYVKDLEGDQKGKDLRPEALRLHVKGIGGLRAVDPTPAARDAAGRERQAIYKGMAELATAKGAAWATAVAATAQGLVDVTTAAGTHILGRVLGTYYIDAAVAGVDKVVGATIATPDGKTQAIVAEGDAAAAVQAAAK